jgi:hypothetical protein
LEKHAAGYPNLQDKRVRPLEGEAENCEGSRPQPLEKVQFRKEHGRQYVTLPAYP